MREVAERGSWAGKLSAASSAKEQLGSFEDYYAWLLATGCEVDIWQTTYVHPLSGARAIVEWFKSTGLKPYLDRLTAEEQTDFLARYIELRNIAAPQVPVPAQEVAIAAYGDEAHVEKNRELYVSKFDLADQIIGNRYGYKRPAGGFFLWLDVSAQGGDEAVARKLWRDGGLRVIPGHYLARDGADGKNPGEGYIRVALVQDKEITAEALHRLVAVLG